MGTEAAIVIKKIVPYLQRRGYSLDDNLYFGERAQNEQEAAGFIDILVKRSPRSSKVLFLIEAKRDTAKLNAGHRDQALRYGRTVGVAFVVTTNGSEFELYNVETKKKLKFNGSVIGKIPHYQNLDNALAQFKVNPQLDNLTFSSDTSLPFRPGLSLPQLHALIRRCHNTIRDVEKDEEEIFSDFSKLLFLKLLEEKADRGELDFALPYTYRFFELAQRRNEPDQVKDAIITMMKKVVGLREYGDVMTPHLRMTKPATYLKVVSELSKASFSDSELDVRGSVFEYFVKTSLKGKKLGQFFTPRPLVRFMLSLLPLDTIITDLYDPNSNVRVIDPACGSGGFLLAGMNHLLQKVEADKKSYSNDRAKYLKERIRKDVFWGAEANQAVASTAKMNMIIAGDGFANIKHGDSLSEQVSFLKMHRDSRPQADFIISNPPFGMSETKSMAAPELSLYDVPIMKSQALFLQKMIRIAKPGARICTVIDEGMLNTANMARIRKHVVDNCYVDAVVSLPDVTFRPNKINVKCDVLLLTKKATDDEGQDFPIRMIELETLGYDAQGEETTDVSIDEIITLVKARWRDIGRLALANYPDFLCGKPKIATSSTTELGVAATRRCIHEWGGDPNRIGLLVAATNTPDHMLPCLASEIMGRTHGLLSRSLRTVSMQAQGCSVLLKSIEVAQWYLAANPGQLAIVVMAEAHTPYVAPLLGNEYFGYREIIRSRKQCTVDPDQFEQQRSETTLVIQSMLFGDGAVALLVGTEEGKPAFGPISHLTNDQPNDMNLLTMIRHSSHPSLKGRPQYLMRPSVPTRGAHYAVTTVKNVLNHPDSPVSDLDQVNDCLIHTGSKKILDGVCSQLDLAPESAKVHGSYKVLERYGNLSSASTGFMLAEKNEWSGPAMVVGFGVGFAASAGIMNFN